MPSLFFFGMGATLLLETQVISRLALYFGTTWQVNGIVISAMLITLLLANMVVQYCSPFLEEKLAFAVAIGQPDWRLFAACVQTAPESNDGWNTDGAGFFCSNILRWLAIWRRIPEDSVSQLCARSEHFSGAVVGGLLENLSLLMGMRALLLITIVFYCLAGFRFRNRSQKVA